MSLTSVIIPCRNDPNIVRTVEDIYHNFAGNFEVIVILDGPEYPHIHGYPNLQVIHQTLSGVRPSINKAVSISSGDYILKVDSHCAFSPEFDINLLVDGIPDNWVMVARRYTLDLDTWKPQPRIVDYYYLSCPWTHPKFFMMQSCPWITYTEAHMDKPIDDLMCFQGSMWMMSRKHWDNLGGLEIGQETYAEHHEISMKTWASGGQVVINKNAWYAHPSHRSHGYKMDMKQVYKDHDLSARIWTNQATFFEWLVDKFWPLPTEHNRHRLEKYYWPENWKEMVRNVD